MLPVPAYDVVSTITETGPGPPHTMDSLTHINCYMDDVITDRPTTRGLQRHGPGTEMAFSVLAWQNQGFYQRQEADSRRGRLDMQKRGVGVADQHGGRNSCPSRAKTPGSPPTTRHPNHAASDRPEGTGALGGEALLHAPHGARSSSTPLPHSALLGTRRKI